MQLKDGTAVYTTDGDHVGNIDRVVIDPQTKAVTDVVVRKGFLFPEDKVIPVEVIARATEDRVLLRRNAGDLGDFPPFEERQYIPIEPRDTGYALPLYAYPPYGLPQFTVDVERNIPQGAVPLKEGAHVISEDGKHIGNVKRVLLEPRHNTITHFVISQGLLFKNEKLVPVNWVRDTREDAVLLAMSADFLDRLPAFEG
jgi:uncharacterized protein YrrD